MLGSFGPLVAKLGGMVCAVQEMMMTRLLLSCPCTEEEMEGSRGCSSSSASLFEAVLLATTQLAPW